MTYKQMRILIVDSTHAQSCQIEKMLNVMGCYCIATASTVEEGLLLSRVGPKRFDVLLAPEHMLISQHDGTLSLAQFEIQYSFIYSRAADVKARFPVVRGHYYQSGLPEYFMLERFISHAIKGLALSRGALQDKKPSPRKAGVVRLQAKGDLPRLSLVAGGHHVRHT